MGVLLDLALYLVSTLLVILTAIKWVNRLKLDGFADKILAYFLFSITEIVIVNIVIGLLLRLLYPIYLFLMVLVIFLVTGFYFKDWSVRIGFSGIRNFFKDIKPGFLFIVLSLTTIIGIVWVLYIIFLFPPYATDEIMYHLAGPVEWIKHGMIYNINQDQISQWVNWYPKNTEMLFLWNMVFLKSDKIAGITQFIFALVGIIGIYGIGRKLGIDNYYSLCGGLMFLLTPVVFIQAKTAYIDVAFSVMVIMALNYLLYLYKEFDMRYVYLFSLSVAFMSGMKGSGAIYAVVFMFLLIIALVRHRNTNSLKSLLFGLFVYILFAVTFGAFWYYRTWYYYGNPVYPFTISFHGITIFKGLGNAKEMIFDPNVPFEMKDMGKLKRIFFSWYENFNFARGYHYDSRIGGFGPVWYILSIPAIIIYFIKSIFDKKWINIFFFFSTVILFWITPENWWTRYVIFILALGYVAIYYLIENIRFTRYIVEPIIPILVLFAIVISIRTYLPLGIESFETFERLKQTPVFDRSAFMANPFYKNDVSFLRDVKNSRIGHFTLGPMYPLYGYGLSNDLFYVGYIENESAFFKYVEENKIEYVVVINNSKYNEWMKEDKQFKLIYEGEMHNVYKVLK
ncbi:MAG TPA: hypothetical protein GXX15_05740 [Clostridia bacterium]|nr:hypothetical protein [Clostridia bacterium]